jgi:hypothetical protein
MTKKLYLNVLKYQIIDFNWYITKNITVKSILAYIYADIVKKYYISLLGLKKIIIVNKNYKCLSNFKIFIIKKLHKI